MPLTMSLARLMENDYTLSYAIECVICYNININLLGQVLTIPLAMLFCIPLEMMLVKPLLCCCLCHWQCICFAMSESNPPNLNALVPQQRVFAVKNCLILFGVRLGWVRWSGWTTAIKANIDIESR
jgi:hypothetical protein